jgi:Tfp pilus assembly protein PilW
MSAPRHIVPRGQRGVTLIGTMVGLLLGILGVVAMLALYRAMVTVSTDTAQSAQRDSQLVSALLGAQMEAQSAGWRIDPAEAGDNVRISSDGRQVLWRFREVDGGPVQCAGLRILAAATEGAGLYQLPATACSGVDDASVQWGSPGRPSPRMLVSAAGFHVGQGEVSILRLDNARFRMQPATCAPYGQGTPVNQHATLTLEADGMPLFGICLPNIKGAPIVSTPQAPA